MGNESKIYSTLATWKYDKVKRSLKDDINFTVLQWNSTSTTSATTVGSFVNSVMKPQMCGQVNFIGCNQCHLHCTSEEQALIPIICQNVEKRPWRPQDKVIGNTNRKVHGETKHERVQQLIDKLTTNLTEVFRCLDQSLP